MSDTEAGGDSLLRILLEVFVIFAIIAGIPFLLGGVWPPFVSIVSDSMDPNLQQGDLVYVVETQGSSDSVAPAGVETIYGAHNESSAKNFNQQGEVIVYYPNGDKRQTPVIHRAEFWVEEGENWYSKAESQYVSASSCQTLQNCPAPNGGFITLGDANNRYDQAADISRPVQVDWVIGSAQYRVPYLGYIRLLIEGAL